MRSDWNIPRPTRRSHRRTRCADFIATRIAAVIRIGGAKADVRYAISDPHIPGFPPIRSPGVAQQPCLCAVIPASQNDCMIDRTRCADRCLIGTEYATGVSGKSRPHADSRRYGAIGENRVLDGIDRSNGILGANVTPTRHGVRVVGDGTACSVACSVRHVCLENRSCNTLRRAQRP